MENYSSSAVVAVAIFLFLQPFVIASAQRDAEGLVLVKESDALPVICIPFRSAMSSPTHVFVETVDGESKQFFRRSVLHVFRLTLPNPADSPNFTSPAHLQPLLEYIKRISVVAEAAPCARTFLEPIRLSLAEVVLRYERGERRLNGQWMSRAEYEKKIKSDLDKSSGAVELRLKNGERVTWPSVRIQGQRLVYVSENGVQSIHRDQLADEVKYLYFPETKPAEGQTQKTDSSTANPAISSDKTTQSLQDTPNQTVVNAPADVDKFVEGNTRFFRLRDGTTHIGRVIASDDQHVMIFTTAAKTYRLRKIDVVVGLEEQLSMPDQ